jgi:hypothetical protein
MRALSKVARRQQELTQALRAFASSAKELVKGDSNPFLRFSNPYPQSVDHSSLLATLPETKASASAPSQRPQAACPPSPSPGGAAPRRSRPCPTACASPRRRCPLLRPPRSASGSTRAAGSSRTRTMARRTSWSTSCSRAPRSVGQGSSRLAMGEGTMGSAMACRDDVQGPPTHARPRTHGAPQHRSPCCRRTAP